MEPHQLPWSPLDPAALPDLLAGVGAPWWLAGGWAIDTFVGEVTRAHEDTDVLGAAGTLRPWPVGETLPVEVHDVWCRPTPSSPWSLQLMIDDTDGEDWVYRRDARLRRPVSSLAGPASDPARLVLAPEVQLLQKSKGRRPKDEADLAVAAPLLSPEARSWLRDALDLVSPGHDWVRSL